jgi:hypothetical protein
MQLMLAWDSDLQHEIKDSNFLCRGQALALPHLKEPVSIATTLHHFPPSLEVQELPWISSDSLTFLNLLGCQLGDTGIFRLCLENFPILAMGLIKIKAKGARAPGCARQARPVWGSTSLKSESLIFSADDAPPITSSRCTCFLVSP